ncbi:MAG: sulfotransferase domain-containing protein [Rhizomicrobium sp.]
MSGIYWLASYPKSGNTWMRLALHSLEQGGAPVRFDEADDAWWQRETDRRVGGIVSSRAFFENYLAVESSDLTAAEVEALRPAAIAAWAEGARAPIVKTHDAYLSAAGTPLFPPGGTQGAVVIVRDPRDVAISFANHSGITIDQSIARMANPNGMLAGKTIGLSGQFRQRLPTWCGHVAGWLDAPIPKLLVLYEDMIADMVSVLTRVAGFVGIAADPGAVARAVAATGFDRLKAEEDKIGFRERSEYAARFFRRGVAGGWRDTLTTAQVAQIETDHGAMMRRLGYGLVSVP